MNQLLECLHQRGGLAHLGSLILEEAQLEAEAGLLSPSEEVIWDGHGG